MAAQRASAILSVAAVSIIKDGLNLGRLHLPAPANVGTHVKEGRRFAVPASPSAGAHIWEAPGGYRPGARPDHRPDPKAQTAICLARCRDNHQRSILNVNRLAVEPHAVIAMESTVIALQVQSAIGIVTATPIKLPEPASSFRIRITPRGLGERMEAASSVGETMRMSRFGCGTSGSIAAEGSWGGALRLSTASFTSLFHCSRFYFASSLAVS